MQIPASVKPARITAYLAVVSLLLIIIGIVGVLVLSYVMGKLSFENNSNAVFTMRKYVLISSWFCILVFVCTIIFIPVWTYQICRNVRTGLNGEKLPFQHLAAWGWFIPIVNFFIPFTSLRRFWFILQANFPVVGLPEKKSIPIQLWQIGFCGLAITMPLSVLLLKFVTKQNILVYNITSLVLFLSILLSSICGIISILQLLRFEKLAYTK
jgi:hypothetical protein